MAKYTFYYDMVVSGSVQIEADSAEAAMQKIYAAETDLRDGLDSSTANFVDGSGQLHDDNGKVVA
jgi:hypothetical protein